MNENNKNKPSHEESPKNAVGVTGAKPSSWKRAMSKKWVFPAVYMAAIAILLTVLVVYQGNKTTKSPELSTSTTSQVDTTTGTDATNGETEVQAKPAAEKSEAIAWPVENEQDVQVVKSFYDENGSTQEKEAAMVEYNDTFTPNAGIDLARKDAKPFDVLAAFSGKVTGATTKPVVGNEVEVTSPDGTVTVYQSLSELKVKQGDEIKQGDVLGTAGRNELEKDLGVHVHFEVRQNDKTVNPATLLGLK